MPGHNLQIYAKWSHSLSDLRCAGRLSAWLRLLCFSRLNLMIGVRSKAKMLTNLPPHLHTQSRAHYILPENLVESLLIQKFWSPNPAPLTVENEKHAIEFALEVCITIKRCRICMRSRASLAGEITINESIRIKYQRSHQHSTGHKNALKRQSTSKC